MPPCIRQRPFFIAGDLHALPLLRTSILDRINSIGYELPILPRSFASFFQGKGIDRTKTHIAGLAIHLET